MIALLFIILVSLAIVQYIYESILLPTIRQQLRFSMFALRDKLRHYAHDEVICPDSREYKLLQSRINVTVDYLYVVDLKIVFDAHKFLKGNPAISNIIANHRRLIESSELAEVREIDGQLKKIFALVLLSNSACFFVWAIPLILILFAIHRTGKTLWYNAKDLVFSMPWVPEREVIKFVPCPKIA